MPDDATEGAAENRYSLPLGLARWWGSNNSMHPSQRLWAWVVPEDTAIVPGTTSLEDLQHSNALTIYTGSSLDLSFTGYISWARQCSLDGTETITIMLHVWSAFIMFNIIKIDENCFLILH